MHHFHQYTPCSISCPGVLLGTSWRFQPQKILLIILLLVRLIYLWNTVQLPWHNPDLILTLLVVNQNLCNALEFSFYIKPYLFFFFFFNLKAYVAIHNWSTISKHLPWVNTGSVLWVLYLISGKLWTSTFPIITLEK